LVPSVAPSSLLSATPTRTATAIPPTPRPSPSPTFIGESAGKIAYVSCGSSEVTSCEIYVINADGSHPIRLTNDSAWNCCPAWSPDGTRLAFVANPNGPVQGPHGAIYVINADGSQLTQLTNFANTAAENPSWSPDGAKIAFANWSAPEVGIIHVMNADGSHMTRLGGVAYFNSPLNWSPDGARIAFESHIYAHDVSSNDIHVLNTDGSGVTNLTDNSFYDGLPAWSPDGTKIAFVSDRDGNAGIYIMNVDGSNATKLVGNVNGHFRLTWSPAMTHRLLQHPDCTSGWTRLKAGGEAKVSEDNPTPNRVRAGPSLGNNIIAQLPPGTIVEVLEGPVCAEGLVFWKVDSDLIASGVGWTAEGDVREYYLQPYVP
jgi:Tol biopolymer transport system component